ncbi:hypothetical protein [Heyndrickxia oleronia]|uniref:hypothetical protein n=1 Tax=Heyndrickxia oleronia TaxID=38875 RepID=UPI001B09601D|nr:hypothetical protein [Heyndrickxia oleronia]GIN42305.1 hypothetical protein J19TS1_52540 [Heyndrickxia oleronia]
MFVTKERLENQRDHYKKLIAGRIEPDNVYYEYILGFPLQKKNDRFYKALLQTLLLLK